MASTCSRLHGGGSGGFTALLFPTLLFTSLFAVLALRFLVLAIESIDEIALAQEFTEVAVAGSQHCCSPHCCSQR
jgi:hypothetical protein